MGKSILSICNLSKYYKLYSTSGKKVKEIFSVSGKSYHEKHYALRNVNIEVNRGEVLGIVGRNGCGKSTLLKLIAGVLEPDEGTITARGSLIALLELGLGFNPEFTGRQNIGFYGTVLGLQPEELAKITPKVIAFAELGQFIDQPIKSYSSGMRAKLGFSLAAHARSDILLLDEVLAVGDELFVKKCYQILREFIKEGRTVIIVTHSAQAVSEFCTRAVLLEGGEILYSGGPKDTLAEYRKILYGAKELGKTLPQPAEKSLSAPPDSPPASGEQFFLPSLKSIPVIDFNQRCLQFHSFSFKVKNENVNVVEFDATIHIDLCLRIIENIDQDSFHAGFTIITQSGLTLASIVTGVVFSKHFITIRSSFECTLNEGIYSMLFSAIDTRDITRLMRIHDLYIFKVISGNKDQFYRWGHVQIK